MLICDDEPDIRRVYRYAFEVEGAEVAEAVDGLDSIEKAGEFRPDLVVLDLAMPKCDGLHALPEIRRRAPDARVVVVTAYSTLDALATSRRLGASACLLKERFVPRIPELLRRYCSG